MAVAKQTPLFAQQDAEPGERNADPAAALDLPFQARQGPHPLARFAQDRRGAGQRRRALGPRAPGSRPRSQRIHPARSKQVSQPAYPVRPHPDRPSDHLAGLSLQTPQNRACPIGFPPIRRTPQPFQGLPILCARRQRAPATSHPMPPDTARQRDSVPVEAFCESCLALRQRSAAGHSRRSEETAR